ncbi:MAG: hypothetical protein QHD01_36785 [Bradyrhizobium sp.]|uniref:hypothetical protein n=1 Tax=Bradyrhizobium sp. TaxID=376 RepID=UPI0029A70636|nr:hypothetical protein [Bradyrhizobium sp.]MDX3972130.1 hypothetical protein [Bradyrhizobium sp.]
MLKLWKWLKSFFSRDKQLDQVRDFVIEVGRCQLACSLVEQQLHDLLRSFGYPDNKVPEWLVSGQNKRLKRAIDALKEQFDLPSSFASELHRFRDRRNEFVHQIWKDPDAKLEVGNGLDKMSQKVAALYRTAKELSDIFGPLLMRLGEKRYQREAKRLEEEIKYWKRESAILGAALAHAEQQTARLGKN